MAFRSGDFVAVVTIAGGALIGAGVVYGGHAVSDTFESADVAVERIESDVRHRVRIEPKVEWQRELERGLRELEVTLEGLEGLEGLKALESLERLERLERLEQLERLENLDFDFDFDFNLDIALDLDLDLDGLEIAIESVEVGEGN